MQLRHARLCLNCEEVHASSHCPACASESFAYVTRWIPPEERRSEPRTAPGRTVSLSTPVAAPHIRWVKRGAAGVAVLAASRLLWNLSRPVQWDSSQLPDERDPEPLDGRAD
ncbi:MAG: hypothetical protein ABL982_03225 [Vicinamibacterales bacterium]